MRKPSVVVLLSVGLLIAGFIGGLGGARADDQSMAVDNDQNQVNDEGYSNSDVEYYNSEDDMLNDEESSSVQENSLTNEQ